MKAIEILMQEHRRIEKMIGILEREADAARSRGRLDEKRAEAALSFIREYADGLHHKKEEDLLFRAMVEAGFPREQGPIGVMLAEHEQGRAFVAVMSASREDAGRGRADAVEEFARAARSYGGLLRQHILKEDGVLYPMALRALDGKTWERLSAEFERVDREGASSRLRYEKSIEELDAAPLPGR